MSNNRDVKQLLNSNVDKDGLCVKIIRKQQPVTQSKKSLFSQCTTTITQAGGGDLRPFQIDQSQYKDVQGNQRRVEESFNPLKDFSTTPDLSKMSANDVDKAVKEIHATLSPQSIEYLQSRKRDQQ
ncbi:hypothetical protein MIR68_008438 [Amoeboaphelidium protococcarum]|nr:hypothetical protein MIR68_008438 [Amoeboaphelidium protococcarum]